MKSKNLGYLAALGYALIIGFAFLFSKGALGYGVYDQLAYRCTIAFLPLLVLFLIRRKHFHYTLSKITKLLLLGILYPTMFFGVQTYGLSITSSLEAGVAQAMAPIVTTILATVFLNETTNWKQKCSMLLSVLGVVYILYRKQILNPNPDFKGIVVLFLATVAFSIYSVAVRKYKDDYTNLEILFVIMAECATFFIALSVYQHIKVGTLSEIFNPLFDKDFMTGVLYLGLLSSLSSGLLLNFALSRIPASNTVIFNNLSTVIQIFAGHYLLGEALYFSHKVGSICIILGVLGVTFLATRKKKKSEEVNV